jgi:DNA-directed RNA polymerase subunit E'/Rpb7
MSFYKRKQKRISDDYIYTESLITRCVYLSIMEIDKNLKETITNKIKKEYEGKCIVEGYIQKDSCKIVSYSSGLIKGVNIIYDVVFRCKTCFPVEGMNINCIAVNITKSAGIRAEIADITPSPAVIFITRDHHYNDDYFSQIKEGDRFSATVIGQRFELNDKFISIIAKLIEPNSQKTFDTKPKIVFDDEIPVPAPSLKSKQVAPSIKAKFVLDENEEPQEDDDEEMVLIPKNIITHNQEEEYVFEENKEDKDLEDDLQDQQEDNEEELEENP